jgi:hypothetical protein
MKTKRKLRLPGTLQEASDVFKWWDGRNGRYWIDTTAIILGRMCKVTFDDDSHVAVQIDGMPVSPEYFGAEISDVKVLSINGTQVDSSRVGRQPTTNESRSDDA